MYHSLDQFEIENRATAAQAIEALIYAESCSTLSETAYTREYLEEPRGFTDLLRSYTRRFYNINIKREKVTGIVAIRAQNAKTRIELEKLRTTIYSVAINRAERMLDRCTGFAPRETIVAIAEREMDLRTLAAMDRAQNRDRIARMM